MKDKQILIDYNEYLELEKAYNKYNELNELIKHVVLKTNIEFNEFELRTIKSVLLDKNILRELLNIEAEKISITY